jgi:hypothetical protein
MVAYLDNHYISLYHVFFVIANKNKSFGVILKGVSLDNADSILDRTTNTVCM